MDTFLIELFPFVHPMVKHRMVVIKRLDPNLLTLRNTDITTANNTNQCEN
jgi:hypothetical protein